MGKKYLKVVGWNSESEQLNFNGETVREELFNQGEVKQD